MFLFTSYSVGVAVVLLIIIGFLCFPSRESLIAKYYDEMREDILALDSVPEGVDRMRSYNYMGRADVKKQYMQYVEQTEAVSVEGNYLSTLGLLYVEMKLKNRTGKVYALNFWPCSDCACVACNCEG
jgi:hypothetical protein